MLAKGAFAMNIPRYAIAPIAIVAALTIAIIALAFIHG
jgi:hypothetical protein